MKKKELPSLPLFTDKFLAETLHINICETGIYIKLLCWYWTKKRGVTKDEAFKIVNDDKYNKSTEYVLKEFFVFNKDNSRYEHKRLEQEHEYLKDYYLNKAKSGKVGGLNSRYTVNSKHTTSKTTAPIPIPIPIPKLNNNNFEIFWSKIFVKKGAKKIANIRYLKECNNEEPLKIALIYNSFISSIKDKQFIPHVATWINQRRFEDEDVVPFNTGPTLTQKMEKLGYKHRGSEDHFEQYTKEGKNYKIHKWEKNAIIIEEK